MGPSIDLVFEKVKAAIKTFGLVLVKICTYINIHGGMGSLLRSTHILIVHDTEIRHQYNHSSPKKSSFNKETKEPE